MLLLGSAPREPCVARPTLIQARGGSFDAADLGVSVLSYLLAMKVDLSSLAAFQLSRYSIPRVLVILNVLDSYVSVRCMHRLTR